MKNVSLMPLVLALTMSFVGSNLYAEDVAKPTPSPAPTATLAETAGKTAGKAGTDFLKGIGGAAAGTAAAAAGIPPLNLNLNIDTKVIKCNDGDNISTVNGDNNQIQNIRGNCDQRIGATGDVARFTLPSTVVTVNKAHQDIKLLPNVAYNFIFDGGRSSAALAAYVAPTVSGFEVVIYTTRTTARDRWTERFRFGVDGQAFTNEAIAPLRVYPDGKVQLFFPDPSNQADAVRLELNVLNRRTVV